MSLLYLGSLWLQSLTGGSTLLDRLFLRQAGLDTNVLRKIQEAVQVRELLAHVYFLASDELGGREAGSPHEKIAARYLVAHHQRIGNVPLATSYILPFSLVPPPRDLRVEVKKAPEGWNVLALRLGKESPSQVVLLTAHYDHLGLSKQGEPYNGADDNGSGTAVLLEVARVLSYLPAPRRTIAFLHTSGEEKGLLGALWFVAQRVIPPESLVAVLNVDMVGRTDTLHKPGEIYLYSIGAQRTSPLLRGIQEAINALCCQWTLDYRYEDPSDRLRLFYRSDHYAFAKVGVPVSFFFGGLHADYHTPADDVEKLEPERLRRVAVLLAALSWTLANL
ncbi:MAG: M28 family peptidase [Bacteroidia bacterium]|nr:M28 family peptidase [Bacteroidia bacterium]MDW8088217.1 M28 family peptidase [Bacteroidia bacterium]